MTTITVADVTAGTLAGEGVFDKLMQSVTAHLNDQYSKGRLTGADYANVYLGSIQSAMQHSVSFIMSANEADRATTQLNDALLSGEKQREEVNARIVLVNTQIQEQVDATRRTNIQLDDALDTSLKQRQHVAEQISLIHVQMAETIDATDRANVQMLDGLDTAVKQRIQLDSAITLSASQNTEVTSGTTRADLDSVQENLVKAAQVLKSASEKALLEKKALTEAEQKILVTKQQELYTAQKTGFTRDAEQKAVKVATELWQVAKGSDSSSEMVFNDVITQTEVGVAVKSLLTSAGVIYT